MQKLIGAVVIILGVFGGYLMAGGYLGTMWQPAELIIILGAGGGSLILGNPQHVIIEMWQQTKAIMVKKDERKLYRELLSMMHHLLEQVRVGGMRALDEHIEEPYQSSMFLAYPEIMEHPKLVVFICDNFRLLAMGKIKGHELEHLLEQEIAAIEDDMLTP